MAPGSAKLFSKKNGAKIAPFDLLPTSLPALAVNGLTRSSGIEEVVDAFLIVLPARGRARRVRCRRVGRDARTKSEKKKPKPKKGKCFLFHLAFLHERPDPTLRPVADAHSQMCSLRRNVSSRFCT